jgi:hypothetical protein
MTEGVGEIMSNRTCKLHGSFIGYIGAKCPVCRMGKVTKDDLTQNLLTLASIQIGYVACLLEQQIIYPIEVLEDEKDRLKTILLRGNNNVHCI